MYLSIGIFGLIFAPCGRGGFLSARRLHTRQCPPTSARRDRRPIDAVVSASERHGVQHPRNGGSALHHHGSARHSSFLDGRRR